MDAQAILGSGDFRYRLIPDWARLPDGWDFNEVAAVAVDSRDQVYVFSRSAHPVTVFDRDGNFLRSWGEGVFKRAHARARLEQALAIYDPDRDRGLRFRYGFDPGVVTMLQLAVVLWQIGEGDRARGLADNGLSLALQSGHIPTVIYAHGCIGIFHALRRDRGRILENAEKLRDVMQAQELQTNWYRVAILFVAWARWFGGDRTVGLDEMRETVVSFP